MTRITSSDQILALLRNHLEHAQRTRKPDAAARTTSRGEVRQTPLQRVKGMLHEERLSDQDVRRALISGMLTQEFGGAVANDPKFQKLIDDVLRLIGRDESGERLLGDAIRQLTSDRPE